jgi:hypothetical protein
VIRTGRAERLLLVLTPAAALSAVALGLRIGAATAVRSAVIYAAPPSDAGTGLAWQVLTFEEERGFREAVSLPDLRVVARTATATAEWYGATNADGAAEALFALPSEESVHLEVRAGASLLAAGQANAFPSSIGRAPPATAWARFARREGRILLDVAVLGQRVPAGFPATIWVRATDASSRRPLAGVAIEPEPDASFLPAAPTAMTDARGWAEIVATPVGHAVTMILNARAPDGGHGVWAGALFVSPGAARLLGRSRFSPEEEPSMDLTVPTVRTTAYVEVDDARGRAWASVVPLSATGGGMPSAGVRIPRLAPGLYWAVASDDPAGGARMGPGTSSRPFVVANSDAAGLSWGTDAATCAPPADGRDAARVLSVCLALAGATPVPRWVALDGFSMQHARDGARRAAGLRLALGAIGVAVLLETLLLLRVAAAARARLRQAASGEDEPSPNATALVGRPWTVGIALLVAMLGFLLLAAFLSRVA